MPNFVAKRWKACCDQAVERGEAVGRPLATLKLVPGTDEVGSPRTTYQLQLEGELEGQDGGACPPGEDTAQQHAFSCCPAMLRLLPCLVLQPRWGRTWTLPQDLHELLTLAYLFCSCAAASVGQGIPQDFVLKNTTKFADPMLAFSDRGGEMGE